MSFVQIKSASTAGQRQRQRSVISLAQMLYFPIETQGALTPFREQVLNYIYRTALGFSGDLMESAIVSAVSEPDEEDSLHLHLALTLKMDWEELDKLHDQVLARLAEWAEDWTDEDQEDYGRWIYFSLSPSSI